MPNTAGASSPKNLVFILCDQFRYDALSCAGNSIVHTPNIDRLAAEGTRFTQATCTVPLCGPSRASLLTGQYTYGHGCTRNASPEQNTGLCEEAYTADERLADMGYTVAYHGKWHTGSANRGCYEGGLGHFTREYKEHIDELYPEGPRTPDLKRDRYTGRLYRYWPLDTMMATRRPGLSIPHHNEAGKALVPAEHSLTAWTVNQTLDFLKSGPREPFAVTCSILHPHAPLIASKPYLHMFDPAKMPMPDTLNDGNPMPHRRCVPDPITLTPEGLGSFISLYYGLVKECDDWVGRILDLLDEKGLGDNTLVVFTADHGELMGDHGTLSKMCFFESSIRVPLLFRLPGTVPAGQEVHTAATGADLLPTMFDLMGLQVPGGLHGRSLRGDLSNHASGPQFAFSEMGPGRCIRSRRWKYTELPQGPMLYNLEEDPKELRNLMSPANITTASRQIATRLQQEMLNLLEGWRIPTGRSWPETAEQR